MDGVWEVKRVGDDVLESGTVELRVGVETVAGKWTGSMALTVAVQAQMVQTTTSSTV